MDFVTFEKANLVLAEDQPEYLPLPVNINPDAHGMPYAYCVQFSPEDIEQIKANGGRLFLNQLTFGHPFQPIGASLTEPETISDLSKEELIKVLSDKADREAQQKKYSRQVPLALKKHVFDNGNTAILPTFPNGDFLPCIAKGTMKLKIDEVLQSAKLAHLELTLIIQCPDMNNFETLNDFPGDYEEKSPNSEKL